MTYEKTLRWMFAQLPMYQKKGASALNNKLDKSLLFDKWLEYPHRSFKTIHVAGTNGKGSSSHMMASVLQEAGYSVGLYTSPHLKDFRERIKINGKPITKDYVVQFIDAHYPFLHEQKLSFFEMTVGMAFAYFKTQEVDIAVIEVGLGGRLDSTNIITPEICLITNIGFDHMKILGNTLDKIATEKAGIIKKGIPVVISEKQPETEAVFKRIARDCNAPIYFAQDEVIGQYSTDLLGNYQQKNIKGAVATLKKLKGLTISESNIKEGLQHVTRNTGLLGRWQILNERPKVICDTAHNKEGLQLVLNQLKLENFDKLHFVLGFVADKNVSELLKLFPKEASYHFVSPQIERGLSKKKLWEIATALGIQGKEGSSIKETIQMVLRQAGDKDLIFVGGSTFTVAEAL